MDKYVLTPEEYFISELIFTAIETQSCDCFMEYYKIPSEHKNLLDVLHSLQDKGILLKSCKFEKGKPLDWETLQFNDHFLRDYRKTSGELGEELLSVYPKEAIIQGQAVPLQNYAKKYKDTDDFYFHYGKAIGWSVPKHEHVLELIKWSRENDGFGLSMNIADFVGSRMWESIEAHKDGENTTILYDNLTTI